MFSFVLAIVLVVIILSLGLIASSGELGPNQCCCDVQCVY